MNKIFKFAIIIAIGFLAGLAGRAVLHDQSTHRVHRTMYLFEKLCLEPYLTGIEVEPNDYHLVSITDVNGDIMWGDNLSRVLFRKNARNCSISAPPIMTFTVKQAEQMADKLEELVTSHFPNLPRDAGMDGTALVARGWLTGPRHSKERWGVSIWAGISGSETLHTWLSFTKPQS